MRRLNIVSDQFFGKDTHPFVPELIDIITPETNFLQKSGNDQWRLSQTKN
jgi:hypothetical protein